MKCVYRQNVPFINRFLINRRRLHIQKQDDKNLHQKFDVIVIGGGHAGCESAAASARCGSKTLLVTQNVNTIALMPCNPSFGGIGKGHLLRELDALDGVCPRLCDQSAVTYQALNRSHGPAALGLRAQVDRSRYPKLMQDEIVHKTPNLYVLEASVDDLIIEKSVGNSERVGGCVLGDGTVVKSDSVIVTTGTFLNAEIFCGSTVKAAGRRGEDASYALAETFKRLGLELGRLRTGTPPRINANTIDFSKFKKVKPDQEPIPFSFMTDKIWITPEEQLPSYYGRTNEKLAQIIQENVNKNRYFIGCEVDAPRYCPSLESKIVRFPDLKHRLFLEHEGFNSPQIYMQGCGLNFEPEVQLEIVRAIHGLENAEMLQPGYGVVYDFVNPRQLNPDLSVKRLPGLYLAGQINGTTGYEEAGSQGVIAGINASWSSRKRNGISNLPDEPLTVERSQGYIGVLIDDLTSLGTSEPYRMFTSRVEFRLNLRADNADLRLTELGNKYGAVGAERYAKFSKIREQFEKCKEILENVEMPMSLWTKFLPDITPRQRPKNAQQILSYHNATLRQLYTVLPDRFHEIKDFIDNKDLENRLKNDGMYALEQKRLTAKMEEVRSEINARLPENINYLEMLNLSVECREKLDQFKPANLAAASRIQGITPEALINLLRYVKKHDQQIRI